MSCAGKTGVLCFNHVLMDFKAAALGANRKVFCQVRPNLVVDVGREVNVFVW